MCGGREPGAHQLQLPPKGSLSRIVAGGMGILFVRLLIVTCALTWKGDVVTVENSDTYIMLDVSRDATGEYKCSLIDNPMMEASEELVVKCKNTYKTQYSTNF